MRIAVLSLTRDRLPYTKACFQSLRENAGCDYDHFVLDQGSADGTADWLTGEYAPRMVRISRENIGIHRGMNALLEMAQTLGSYDLLVKVDNDCEVLTPGTLKAVAEFVLAASEPRVVSPLVLGLRHRPSMRQIKLVDGMRVAVTGQIGGIFMPLPPSFLADGFRYDERAPVWGGDDERISTMAHEQGGYTGYLLDYEARHYLGTEGQAADIPEYFARREREGGPAI